MDGQQPDPLAPDPNEQTQDDLPPDDPSQTYWATWDDESLCAALDEKTDAYFETARSRGLLSMWIVAYAALHGLTPEDLRDFATQQIGFVGNELELLRFHINVVRGYIRNQTTMALGDRPEFKAVMSNNDHQSFARSEIANGAVNGLYKRYLEATDTPAAESDGAFGGGGTHIRWDFAGGDMVTTTEQVDAPQADGSMATVNQKVRKKSGAPVSSVIRPWNTIQETQEQAQTLWMLVREPDSLWNLIGQFPAKKQQILDQGRQDDKWDFRTLFRLDDLSYRNNDRIVVDHFYHAPCAIIPMGRYVVKYGSLVVWSGACPTKEGLPADMMTSGKFVETTFGYADAWDLFAIQQALNQVNSDELQNYAQFGKQSIAIEQGTKVSIDAIAKGTAFYVPAKGQMPQALNAVAIPATLPNLKDYLHKALDLISGQNAASRGDPDPNVRSGEMNALLDAIALRYQNFRQEAVRRHRIRKAEILLNFMDRYSTDAFLVQIAGVDNKPFLAEYTKDDVSDVQRITIDPVPPIMQSASGRFQVYSQILTLPPSERASAYEMVVNGNTSQFLKVDRSSERYIERENERLVTGEGSTFVLMEDDPFLHFPQHVACRARILASDNPDMEAVGRINQHLQQHQQTYLGASPLICGFMGIQPPPTITPTPGNPMGNPAFQFMIQTGGGGAPQPMAGSPGAQGAGPGGPEPKDTSNGAQPSGGAAQRSDSGQGKQLAPNGTPLPQPSQPPAQQQ